MCDTFNHMFWVIILRLTGCRPGINTNVKLLLLIFFASCSRQVMWLCMILIWRSAFFASYSRCSALNYWTTSSSCNPLALFLLLLLLLLHLLICSFILFSAKISIMLMLLNQIPKKKGLFYTILMHRLHWVYRLHISPYITRCMCFLVHQRATGQVWHVAWLVEMIMHLLYLFKLIPTINTGKNMSKRCNSVPLNLSATCKTQTPMFPSI